MTQGTLFDLDEGLSMDKDQISDSLKRIFNDGKSRIVFWHDPEKEFEDAVRSLDLPGIGILNQSEHPSLDLKIRLELDDPEERYLIYAPFAEPAPEKDWLLDIRLFSHTFRADRASIIMNELGLASQSLRPYIATRKAFFRNQDRLNRLKKWVHSTDGEHDLELKILAVLAKADQPEIFSILIRLCDGLCEDGKFKPEQVSPSWEDIEKYGLLPFFWKQMAQTFGYCPASPKLTDLLLRLLVTDMAVNLKTGLPTALKHFELNSGVYALNASVFVSQWRNSLNSCKHYRSISTHFAKQLKLDDLLQSFNAEALSEIMTFEVVERRIIRAIKALVRPEAVDHFDLPQRIIQKRLSGYWTAAVMADEGGSNLYRTTYQAIQLAMEMYRLRHKHDSGLGYPHAEAMFQAYRDELFRFDQYYRKFCLAADKVELGGWDVLKDLKQGIENCYSGWFMDQISLSWGNFLETAPGAGLLHLWKLPSVHRQTSFYADHVKGVLDASARNRVFVIISDAFRYEAAEELVGEINSKYRFEAKLEAMLGVLPSYTALGMAALLPRKSLAYGENGDIQVDGKPVTGLDQRSAVSADYEGTAIRADELLAMNKQQGREFLKPYRLVYVYHNQIDAVGDKQVSEHKTFEAVQKSLEEIGALISFIINSLNGGYVIVTADHGFIYQEKSPDPIDKSALEGKVDGAVVAKKRYILGRNLGSSAKAWHGKTTITADTGGDMEFWIPKGTNRFHFTGGSRFFHGGAMLQEIVVPVVIVRELRGKAREESAIRQVGVSLLGSVKKVVTNRHRFEFIQTDPVSERMKPRQLKISLRDGDELISNEETMTFASESSSIDDRKKSVMMMLKAKNYDSKKEYSLVLRDPETEIEYDRIAIRIDLAFKDEF